MDAAPDIDVCGIGSALVDILVEAGTDQVEACGLIKGSMQLVDMARSTGIESRVPTGLERSGVGVTFRRMLTWPAIRRHASRRYLLSVALGAGCLLTTIALQSGVLYLSVEEIPVIAGAWFLAHVALAVLEGILTAGIVDFLLRVKPELLGVSRDFAEPIATVEERIHVSMLTRSSAAGTPRRATLPTDRARG